MSLFLYLLLAGPGAGFDPSAGMGSAFLFSPGPVTLRLVTDFYNQHKQEFDSGYRASALLEAQYGQSLFGSLGVSVSYTSTPDWAKTATRPVIGLGAQRRDVSITLRGYLPDDTANDLSGIQLQLERSGRFYLRGRISFWRFNQSRTDWTADLGVGIRLEAEE